MNRDLYLRALMYLGFKLANDKKNPPQPAEAFLYQELFRYQENKIQ